MEYKPEILDKINPEKVATDYAAELGHSIPAIDVAFVGTLLGKVFGVESPVYLPTWWHERDYTPDPYSAHLDTILADDGSPVRFGQKTFGAFTLKGGKYPTYNQYTGALEYLNYGDFLMPLATIVEFSREKSIVKTPTQGSSGSVKEIFGFDDWAININGIILPDGERAISQQTVTGQMYDIQRFCEIAGAIDVEGSIFFNRRISRIVLEKPTFTPIQGKPNMMQYSITATSDEDILLIEK
jgi:hypothetical protein